METKVLAFRSWDDLVFANRNQTYGAYLIRKAYSRRLLLGWGISTALIAVLLLLHEMAPAPAEIRPTLPVIKEDGLTLVDYVPPIKEPEVLRRTASLPVTNNANTPPLVVTEAVEPPAELETDIVFTSTPDEGGEGGGLIDGLGNAVITDVIPVVQSPPPYVLTAEVMPVYEGGLEALMKFIKKKIRYPASPRRQGIQGTVFVSFVVNGDGSVGNVSVIRGIHADCDEEAIRVISMLPDWIGGKQNGNPVAVKMVLPIKFSLQ